MAPKKTEPDRPKQGRFAYEGLSRIIHERARLSILTSLAAHPEGIAFNDLKTLCALTDGNLSRQLQALQEAKLVEVWKRQKGNRPQTLCRISKHGRKQFLEYIEVLERVVNDAVATEPEPQAARNRRGGSLGFAT